MCGGDEPDRDRARDVDRVHDRDVDRVHDLDRVHDRPPQSLSTPISYGR